AWGSYSPMSVASETSRIAAGVPAASGRVRLRTLIAIRWVAVAGQAMALLIVHFVLGYPLPIEAALIAVGVSVGVNVWATVGRRSPERLGDRAAAAYLAYDLVQLGVLLYLTGGLHNPFAFLILAPVTVSATILSRFSTIALSALALLVVIVLGIDHQPLPWPDQSFSLEPLFIFGLALALGLSVVFIAGYVFSVAEEARRMSAALTASYMALDREQRVSALGALAAAAAHRLGSPLGTIAVIAKELARDLPNDSPHRDDVKLLLSESERCRTILAELSTRPEAHDLPQRMPIAALLETAASPYRADGIRLVLEATPGAAGGAVAAPLVAPSPELIHGLGNLLQNAIEFARGEVRVAIHWDERYVSLVIQDDGPGFAPGLLDHIGEPYLSGGVQGRTGKGEPMGLGVFIAQTLLGRTGATLHFGNGAKGGGEVTISWSRAALEADPAKAW
ncbi:MAG TPA: ActS/PrrB/RegB family redox-sensitive histidine kinase, partial [Dongiaceae bacterium]|nr:ActS/PrrB/RegB family redox-sensitive histidine kinase [Dongiaceae bacterium]